ncbi:MAG: RNase P modulator RnpM [bacterium]
MAKIKKIPQRMCIGCQLMKNKNELIRVVKTPEGEIAVDVTGKKAGRGAYLCRSYECLEKALKTKKLDRAFHTGLKEEDIEAVKKGWEQVVTDKG